MFLGYQSSQISGFIINKGQVFDEINVCHLHQGSRWSAVLTKMVGVVLIKRLALIDSETSSLT